MSIQRRGWLTTGLERRFERLGKMAWGEGKILKRESFFALVMGGEVGFALPLAFLLFVGSSWEMIPPLFIGSALLLVAVGGLRYLRVSLSRMIVALFTLIGTFFFSFWAWIFPFPGEGVLLLFIQALFWSSAWQQGWFLSKGIRRGIFSYSLGVVHLSWAVGLVIGTGIFFLLGGFIPLALLLLILCLCTLPLPFLAWRWPLGEDWNRKREEERETKALWGVIFRYAPHLLNLTLALAVAGVLLPLLLLLAFRGIREPFAFLEIAGGGCAGCLILLLYDLWRRWITPHKLALLFALSFPLLSLLGVLLILLSNGESSWGVFFSFASAIGMGVAAFMLPIQEVGNRLPDSLWEEFLQLVGLFILPIGLLFGAILATLLLPFSSLWVLGGIALGLIVLLLGWAILWGFTFEPLALDVGVNERGLGELALSRSSLRKATPQEICALLEEWDPNALNLGLWLAAESPHPESYLGAILPLLSNPLMSSIREGVNRYFAFLPRSHFLELIREQDPTLAERLLIVAAIKKIPIGLSLLRHALESEDEGVRLAACFLSYRLGFGTVADVTWRHLNLSNLSERRLLDFLGDIPPDAPLQMLAMMKRLVYFPSPAVSLAAMEALGRILEERRVGDADLLEMGLSRSQHEQPAVRAAALKLIVASGTDNAAEHLAFRCLDPSDQVRDCAATLLGELKKGYLVAEELLSEPHLWVVKAAIQAMGGRGEGVRLLRKWVERWQEESHTLAHLPRELKEGGEEFAFLALTLRNRAEELLELLADGWEWVLWEGPAELLREILRGRQRGEEGREAQEKLARLLSKRKLLSLQPLLEDEPLWNPQPQGRVDLQNPRLKEALVGLQKAPNRWIRFSAHRLLAPSHLTEKEKKMMQRLLFLKHVPHFQSLVLDELLLLHEQMNVEEFSEGEVIFQAGSRGDRFYLVYKGSVFLKKEEGEVLATLKESEGFGEMALFEDVPRSATAVAGPSCTLLSLDKKRFEKLILERPRILLQIARELSRRLRQMSGR